MNNNCMNGEYIVSYDKTKTWITNINDMYIFNKKTDINEFNNLNLAKEMFKGYSILVENKGYEIYVPNIISWDNHNNILQLEYCEGINLEFILRDKNTHEKGVLILNSMLDLLVSNKIYWSDFAPRNILLSEHRICIVDFEKGFMDVESKLVDVFRNHIYEEYCLFLLSNERKNYVDNIFDIRTSEDDIIKLDNLKNNRIREIAKLLGYKESILKSDCLKILKMILEVEEPYVEDGKYIYPGVILDKYMINNVSDNPVLDYSKKLIELYKSKRKY